MIIETRSCIASPQPVVSLRKVRYKARLQFALALSLPLLALAAGVALAAARYGIL